MLQEIYINIIPPNVFVYFLKFCFRKKWEATNNIGFHSRIAAQNYFQIGKFVEANQRVHKPRNINKPLFL